MKPKLVEQAAARRLRRRGVPMKQIAPRLGVSAASVHLWTSDLALTPAQRRRIDERAQALRSETWRERNRARRRVFQEEGRLKTRENDPLHRAGCMLYWAEGPSSEMGSFSRTRI
jgi:hypothetical protein